VVATGDGKVEFIAFADHTLAYVRSALGYPAYYPVHPVTLRQPVKAVLMDLDGTSVRSEDFWIWIIQRSIASLIERPAFELEDADLPYVSGHSVSEHLSYCLDKYCPEKSLEEARRLYFVHAHAELAAIARGEGSVAAFQPAPGLKEFLLALKERHICAHAHVCTLIDIVSFYAKIRKQLAKIVKINNSLWSDRFCFCLYVFDLLTIGLYYPSMSYTKGKSCDTRS
jgi:hypothetical protein